VQFGYRVDEVDIHHQTRGKRIFVYSVEAWKAFKSVFSRHQQHSPLRDVDNSTSPRTKGCRNNCWTREEIQVVWDEFFERMGKEELENLENYMEE
jgi:hypothetical protein